MAIRYEHGPSAATVAAPHFAAGKGKLKEYADALALKLLSLRQNEQQMEQQERMQIRSLGVNRLNNLDALAARQQSQVLGDVFQRANQQDALAGRLIQNQQDNQSLYERQQLQGENAYGLQTLRGQQDFGEYQLRGQMSADEQFEKTKQERMQQGYQYSPTQQQLIDKAQAEEARIQDLVARGQILPWQAQGAIAKLHEQQRILPSMQGKTQEQIKAEREQQLSSSILPVTDPTTGKQSGWAIFDDETNKVSKFTPMPKDQADILTFQREKWESDRRLKLAEMARDIYNAEYKLYVDTSSPRGKKPDYMEIYSKLAATAAGDIQAGAPPAVSIADEPVDPELKEMEAAQFDTDQNEMVPVDESSTLPADPNQVMFGKMREEPAAAPVEPPAQVTEQVPAQPVGPPVIATLPPAQRAKVATQWAKHRHADQPSVSGLIAKRNELLQAPASEQTMQVLKAIDIVLAYSNAEKVPDDLGLLMEAKAILDGAGIDVLKPPVESQTEPSFESGVGLF